MVNGCEASIDAGFKRFMGVHDLNSERPICEAHGFDRPGVTHERGQDAVCAGDGVRALEDLRSHHRAAQRRCGRAHAGLRRLVSRHDLRAAHVARVAARHRGLPGRQSCQAFSHGDEGAASAFDAGRCAQPSRLAHLPCTGPAADRSCQGAVCPRAFGARTRCQRLCVGLHHHRSVSEPVQTGRRFDRPRQPSNCTRFSTCVAQSRPSSTSAMASCTMSTCWISCRSRPVPST